MRRLRDQRYAEAIWYAYSLLPDPVAGRLQGVDFLCGVDPVWAGLHRDERAGDGRSYRDTAHCCYPWHTSDRTTTIVLPSADDAEPWKVVHELGHALDQRLGFAHRAAPITAYARTNRQEAFAESFTGWLFRYGNQDVWNRDLATRALFASLEGVNP